MVQQFADRKTHLGCSQLVRRDLIEQWLEGVVVVFVDDRDPDIRVAQFFDCADAAEAGTQDHHMKLTSHSIQFLPYDASLQARTAVHHAAVGEDRGRRHVAGSITGQEGHHAGDFFGLGHAA